MFNLGVVPSSAKLAKRMKAAARGRASWSRLIDVKTQLNANTLSSLALSPQWLRHQNLGGFPSPALSRDGLQPTLLAMASNRVAMASNIRAMAWFLAFQVPSAHVTGHETHLLHFLIAAGKAAARRSGFSNFIVSRNALSCGWGWGFISLQITSFNGGGKCTPSSVHMTAHVLGHCWPTNNLILNLSVFI